MSSSSPIAVIGMACWYPGACNPRQLWENILTRRLQFRRFPVKRLSETDYYHPDQNTADKTYMLRAAFIDGFNFDWASYRIPFSTFESTDIAHWLALDIVLKAIDDAGFSKENIPGDYTGVIVGNTLTGEQSRSNIMRLRWPYVRRAFLTAVQAKGLSESQIQNIETVMEKYYKSAFPTPNEDTLAGSLSNTIAGRICNFLNLHGGGYTVDGACSSSLLAVATAATGLAKGDFNMALAGGVDISLDPFELVGFAKTGALTMEEMTVYDRRGGGFIPGEGCGFVVLKRLEDARRDNNYIYAVLHGWGISSDGSGTGITAPSSKGQSQSLKKAYASAPYGMESLNFIEGHGTGTTVGDKVELKGISLAMADTAAVADRSCGVTSLKSIIGHTKAASGIGGLIKAVISVNRRILPPTASCRDPHPIFDTQARCLYPVLQGEIFEKTKILRAGVSAMGFGGINCHITLESGNSPSPVLEPSIEERSLLVSNQDTELFVLTSNSLSGLEKKASSYLKAVKEISIAELTDLAAKLAHEAERKAEYRGAVIARRPDELHQRLEQLIEMTRDNSLTTQPDSARTIWLGSGMKQMQIGMLFPGQGSQQLNMARMLVERFPWARKIVTQADQWLIEAGYGPISKIIYPPLDRAAGPEEVDKWFDMLSLTENAQPAICLASLLWSQFLNKLGIIPIAVGGHSLGELTAFYAAGGFDIRELIQLAAVRGRAMAASGDRAGAMVSLRCSREEAEELITMVTGYIVLANINSPHQIILSGETAAVNDAIQKAAKKGIATRRLKVSNGFHSRLVAGAAEALSKEKLLDRPLSELNIRFFSSMTGKELEPVTSLSQHFSKQIIAPVDFINMVHCMEEVCDLFIEVGPGRVLSSLANDITGQKGLRCMPVESKPLRDHYLNTIIAELFIRGVDINWNVFYDRRLIRPFVPPSKKSFIENPCEHPFKDGPVIPVISQSTKEEIPDNLLASLLPFSDDELNAYLKSRGLFLAQVIQADLKYTTVDGVIKELVQMQKTASPQKSEAITFEDKTTGFQTILYNIVQEVTGFQPETFSHETRLLDDLNLDSIKAGELIARFAQECGIEGQLDPAAVSNATLQEIIDAAMRLKQESKSKPGSVQIEASQQQEEETLPALEIVLNQTSIITGYPRESLDADALVQKDLNLNEEILRELLQNLAVIFSVKTHIDLEPIRRRSLRQISEIFERMVANQKQRQPSLPVSMPDFGTWVREFAVDSYEETQPPLPEWLGKRQEDDWQNCNSLIVSDPDSAELVEAMRKELLQKGAQVHTLSLKEVREQGGVVQDAAFSHIIAILPQTHDKEPDARSLHGLVHRLASISSPPPSSKAPRRRTTVAYIQFGGGYFGRHPQFSYFNQCCATALAASLYLERDDLRIRVLDFSPTIAPELITEKCIAEISTPESFAAVGFDYELTRRVEKVRLLQPAAYQSRSHKWSKDDVVLVTGGARGITASCALGLAQTTGVRIALIGRSPHPETEPYSRRTQGITDTLQAYKDRGLVVNYFSCDVTNSDSVNYMIHRINQEMGPITGVIHGAGLNTPRLASQSKPEEILREVSPKVTGALNLISALKDAPLKLFVGLTSIIGITGMPGNSWYGFSNEALDIILQRFEAEHPQIRTLSIAYSVWQDVGMGARLGSIDKLKKMGIDAIPVEEGVNRFVKLFLNDPGTHQVIVTTRLGGLETWNLIEVSTPENARYLEQMLLNTPGVESVFQAHLTLEKDIYLKDHLFNGVYLMPAVFGLEAMAQTAAHAAGIIDFSRVRIANIKLDRPITVDSDTGADIVIRAETQEKRLDSSTLIIHAAIYKAHTGINASFFSATFELGLMDKPPKHEIPVSKIPPAIRPIPDLYRKTLLFQGPLFQRIEKILALEMTEEKGEYASFMTKMVDHIHAGKEAFLNSHHQTILLGDPFFRDSLLQSAALLIPQDTSLPIYIKQLDIFPHVGEKQKMILATVRLDHITKKEIKNTVITVDSDGTVLETVEGYKINILQHHDEYPTVSDLIKPDQRDTLLIKQALDRIRKSFAFEMPEVLLQYIPGIHNLPREEKHQKELPLMQEVVKNVIKKTPELSKDFKVTWLDSGKPVVAGLEQQEIGISLSHDERLCLTVAGAGPQGCDIAPITSRTRQEWTALLGDKQNDLLMSLLDSGDSLNLAGTRIWAAMETLYKAANNNKDILLDIFSKEKEYVIFQSKNREVLFKILTFPLDLTWGPERIISLVVHKKMAHVSKQNEKDILSSITTDYEDILNIRHMEVRKDPGPQGQPVLINRILVAFRPSAHISRNIYFSHYFFWVGEVREFSVWPVLGRIGEMIATGKWGLVTNFTDLKIMGEAKTQDKIEVHMWASDNGGPENSTMELTLDFRKNLPDGSSERLAWCVQQTTWVQILEHGIVRPEPYPIFYWEFVKKMQPRFDAPNIAQPLPEPLTGILEQARCEQETYRASLGPKVKPLLYEKTIETSFDNSNIVGNIYYANYYVWQGQIRDSYFFKLIPECFRGIGDNGELLCLETRVNHLREAMPFDTIIVTMALKALKTSSATFYFEYFRLEHNGTRVKLAFGEQNAAWVVRCSQGRPSLAPFQAKVQEAFQQAIQKEESS